MEKKPVIQAGMRIGKLTIAEKTAHRKNGYIIWRCRCDCGKDILLDTRCLQRGTITDCGCTTNVGPGQKDLTGQRFGRLLCIAPTDQRGRSGGTVWNCRCDCGNQCLAVSVQLIKGHKKSCGCRGNPPIEDLTGRAFGKLTVLAQAEWKNRTSYWKCRCDCGNETTVRYSYLITGHTRSCGCLQRSTYRSNLQLIDGTAVAILEANKKRTISSNSSGYNGIYLNKKTKKWVAQITFKRKTYYLGSYDKLEDAVSARRSGEELHDDFLEWYYQTHRKNKDSTGN